MKKIIYFDCCSGVTANLILAALIDIGLEKESILQVLSKLPFEGYSFSCNKESIDGISATTVDFSFDHEDFIMSMNSVEKKTLSAAETLMNASSISDEIKTLSTNIIRSLFKAYASVQKKEIAEAEVQTFDFGESILYGVAIAACVCALKPDIFQANAIGINSNLSEVVVDSKKIILPLTQELLRNKQIRMIEKPYLITTPLGIAVLNTIVHSFSSDINFNAFSYGCGRNFPIQKTMQMFAVYLGNNGEAQTEKDTVNTVNDEAIIIECNIDDMNPEIYDYLLDRLFTYGADDAYLTPIIMKKSRPATMVRILCKKSLLQKILNTVLTETSTFGVRVFPVTKYTLNRETVKIETRFGSIAVKKALMNDTLVKQKPEFEDCKRLALKNNVSIQVVLDEVMKQLMIGTNCPPAEGAKHQKKT